MELQILYTYCITLPANITVERFIFHNICNGRNRPVIVLIMYEAVRKRGQFIVGYFRLLSLGFILSRALKASGELIFSFHVSLNKSENSWRYD